MKKWNFKVSIEKEMKITIYDKKATKKDAIKEARDGLFYIIQLCPNDIKVEEIKK